MNRSELIEATAKEAGLSQAATGKVLTALISTIMATVAEGDNVSLVGFGAFKASPRAARMGKNPKTKEPLKIPATIVPKFSAGATFKEAVAKKKKPTKK